MQTHSKTSIAIALIHNNDPQRLAYIKPHIESLIQQLKNKYSVYLIEESYQPSIQPISPLIRLYKNYMYRKTQYLWDNCRHPRNKVKSLLKYAHSLLKDTLKIFSAKHNPYRRTIEVLLTDKHIRAYAKALELNVDYLISFEDDAIFKSDSVARITHLLDNLNTHHVSDSVYINLGGGFSLDVLDVSTLQAKTDNEYVYFSKAFTNTTCVHLVNKKLLQECYGQITTHPKIRYMPIDWMLNLMFLDLLAHNPTAIHSRHAIPEVFEHGSFKNTYKMLL